MAKVVEPLPWQPGAFEMVVEASKDVPCHEGSAQADSEHIGLFGAR
jgi:hypothetical protein